MDVRDFDFNLPTELIAQEPAAVRGGARMLYLDRASGSLTHTLVSALPDLLHPGDLVVVNDTRVFSGAPAGTSPRPERRRRRNASWSRQGQTQV